MATPSGTRLASIYREKVKLEDIPEVLSPLLDRWASEGEPDEAFGDFVVRVGAAMTVYLVGAGPG